MKAPRLSRSVRIKWHSQKMDRKLIFFDYEPQFPKYAYTVGAVSRVCIGAGELRCCAVSWPRMHEVIIPNKLVCEVPPHHTSVDVKCLHFSRVYM